MVVAAAAVAARDSNITPLEAGVANTAANALPALVVSRAINPAFAQASAKVRPATRTFTSKSPNRVLSAKMNVKSGSNTRPAMWV